MIILLSQVSYLAEEGEWEKSLAALSSSPEDSSFCSASIVSYTSMGVACFVKGDMQHKELFKQVNADLRYHISIRVFEEQVVFLTEVTLLSKRGPTLPEGRRAVHGPGGAIVFLY